MFQIFKIKINFKQAVNIFFKTFIKKVKIFLKINFKMFHHLLKEKPQLL